MLQEKTIRILLISIVVALSSVHASAMDIMLTGGPTKTKNLGISYSKLKQAFSADFTLEKQNEQTEGGQDFYVGISEKCRCGLMVTVKDSNVTSVNLVYIIRPEMTLDKLDRIAKLFVLAGVACEECKGIGFVDWIQTSSGKLLHDSTSTSISKVFGNKKVSLEWINRNIGDQVFRIEPN